MCMDNICCRSMMDGIIRIAVSWQAGSFGPCSLLFTAFVPHTTVKAVVLTAVAKTAPPLSGRRPKRLERVRLAQRKERRTDITKKTKNVLKKLAALYSSSMRMKRGSWAMDSSGAGEARLPAAGS